MSQTMTCKGRIFDRKSHLMGVESIGFRGIRLERWNMRADMEAISFVPQVSPVRLVASPHERSEGRQRVFSEAVIQLCLTA